MQKHRGERKLCVQGMGNQAVRLQLGEYRETGHRLSQSSQVTDYLGFCRLR